MQYNGSNIIRVFLTSATVWGKPYWTAGSSLHAVDSGTQTPSILWLCLLLGPCDSSWCKEKKKPWRRQTPSWGSWLDPWLELSLGLIKPKPWLELRHITLTLLMKIGHGSHLNANGWWVGNVVPVCLATSQGQLCN